jgi:tetratricopeptide (TPR) repeat protein
MTVRLRPQRPPPIGASKGRSRWPRALCTISLALCSAPGLVACATPAPLALTPQELRRELGERIGNLDSADVIVPFEVGDDAVDLARQKLVPIIDPARRARALADLLRSPEGFGLRYEWANTDTAEGTLRRGGGNCMALSSVLIGIARNLGMTAHYLEVLVADPTRRDDAGVVVYADHVAAVIATGQGRLFIDYSGELPHARGVRTISDLEAVSNFYNNRGYELMHRADGLGEEIPWEQVAREFELATRVHPQLARAWNNLGVARARLADDDGARRAYERAIEVQPELRAAHVNLAMLLLRVGDEAGAATQFESARRLEASGSARTRAPGASEAPAPPGDEGAPSP